MVTSLADFAAAAPTLASILPARTDGPHYELGGARAWGGIPKLIAFLSDQQAPYHDPNLHRLVCQWLRENTPDTIICGGDGVDLPSLTRHGRQLAREASIQECVDGMYQVARDYVEAAPRSSERYYIEGNHEQHLEREITARFPELLELRRADDATGGGVLSVPYLLRLDELGYEYVGDYPHGLVQLAPHLAAAHGWLARSDSGQSGLKTLEKRGHSIVIGHTHRKSTTFRTLWTAGGDEIVHCAIESGTLATVEGGLGYDPASNWQRGFAVIRVWSDGMFHASHAIYVNKTLLWEDQQYA